MYRPLNAIHCKGFKPLHNNVFVEELEAGARVTPAGIILPDDNMQNSGIRSRWGKVYCVGPDVDDIKPGDWLLISHGRWTLSIDLDIEGESEVHRIWKVEYPDGVLLLSEDDPRTNALSAVPEKMNPMVRDQYSTAKKPSLTIISKNG